MPTDLFPSVALSPESTLHLWREGGALPGSGTVEAGAAQIREKVDGLNPQNVPLRLNCSFKRIPFARWKSVTHFSLVAAKVDQTFRDQHATLYCEKDTLAAQLTELRGALQEAEETAEVGALVESLQTENLDLRLKLRQAIGDGDNISRRLSGQLQHAQNCQHDLQATVDALNAASQLGGSTNAVQAVVEENKRLKEELNSSAKRRTSPDGSRRSVSREGNSLAPIVAQLELAKAQLQTQMRELADQLEAKEEEMKGRQAEMDATQEQWAAVQAEWASKEQQWQVGQRESSQQHTSPASAGKCEELQTIVEVMQYQLEEAKMKLQNAELLAENACTMAEKHSLELQLSEHKAAKMSKSHQNEKGQWERAMRENPRADHSGSSAEGSSAHLLRVSLRSPRSTAEGVSPDVKLERMLALSRAAGDSWTRLWERVACHVASWRHRCTRARFEQQRTLHDALLAGIVQQLVHQQAHRVLLRLRVGNLQQLRLEDLEDLESLKRTSPSHTERQEEAQHTEQQQNQALQQLEAQHSEELAELQSINQITAEAHQQQQNQQLAALTDRSVQMQAEIEQLNAASEAGQKKSDRERAIEAAQLEEVRYELAEMTQQREDEAEIAAQKEGKLASHRETISELHSRLEDLQALRVEAANVVVALEERDSHIAQLSHGLEQAVGKCTDLEAQLHRAHREQVELKESRLQEVDCLNGVLEELQREKTQRDIQTEIDQSIQQSVVVDSSRAHTAQHVRLFLNYSCQALCHTLLNYYTWALEFGFCRWRECVILHVAITELERISVECNTVQDNLSLVQRQLASAHKQSSAKTHSVHAKATDTVRRLHQVQDMMWWKWCEQAIKSCFHLWKTPAAAPSHVAAVTRFVTSSLRCRDLSSAFVCWREFVFSVVTVRHLEQREAVTTEAFQELVAQLEGVQSRLRKNVALSMLHVGTVALCRALVSTGFSLWVRAVRAAQKCRQLTEQGDKQECVMQQQEQQMAPLASWIELLNKRSHRAVWQWVVVSWSRVSGARAFALWKQQSLLWRPRAQQELKVLVVRHVSRHAEHFQKRHFRCLLLRGFFRWKDCVLASMLVQDLGSVESLKDQQGEILFEYIAMANRRRHHELRRLWGFAVWLEVTRCENAWHNVDVLQTRFRREQLAGSVALWAAEASQSLGVRRMQSECDQISAQTHSIEARFSRVQRTKFLVTQQTMAAQKSSLKNAKNAMLRMLLCLASILQRWGIECWMKCVQRRKLHTARRKGLKRRNLMRMGMAMERWNNQASRMAERTAFEMQLFQTKSQLAGAHKGIDLIQPLVLEAERRAHSELGAHRTAVLLARAVMIGKVKAFAHWRERVAGRALVSRLLSQMVDDATLEHGLRDLYCTWQDNWPEPTSGARSEQVGGSEDWIRGVSKMSSEMQEASNEEQLRAAAVEYANQKKDYLEELGSNVQKSADFLESKANCALVLQMQTNARKKAQKPAANCGAPVSHYALGESNRSHSAKGQLPSDRHADAEWEHMQYDALERVRCEDHLTSWLQNRSNEETFE